MPSVTGESTSPSQTGIYRFTLLSESVIYPQLIIPRELLVTIDECIVTRFEFGAALDDVVYILDSPTLEREIESFIIEPAC